VDIRGSTARVVARERLVRIPEPPPVGGDDLETFGQDRNLVAPAIPELRPALAEDPWRSLAMGHVMQAQAVDDGRAMVPLERHRGPLLCRLPDACRASSAPPKSHVPSTRVEAHPNAVNPAAPH